MKIKYLVLVPALLIFGCKNQKNLGNHGNFEKYDHVVIFGVDGAGGAFKDVETPNFDRIFSSGSINYQGIAESPTISAQNWGSMVYGVQCSVHQKTNGYIAENKHTIEALPSFVKTYIDKHQDRTAYSAVNWTPINYGLFEDMSQLTKDDISERSGLSGAQIDEKVSEHVINRLNTNLDAITFMQFDSVDGAGHSYGQSSSQYHQAIQHIDTLIGNIYDAYVNKGIASKTLFICVSDHGHKESGGHGGDSAAEKAVTFAVNGGLNNVIQGSSGEYHTYDLASVVLYALGESRPAQYQGRVPSNLFRN